MLSLALRCFWCGYSGDNLETEQGLFCRRCGKLIQPKYYKNINAYNQPHNRPNKDNMTLRSNDLSK